jgi:hypothetical protein
VTDEHDLGRVWRDDELALGIVLAHGHAR